MMRAHCQRLIRGIQRHVTNQMSTLTSAKVCRVLWPAIHTSRGLHHSAALPPAATAPGMSQLEALRQRGLINDAVASHMNSSRVEQLDISDDGKYVTITWGENDMSRFHAVWLRHSCHCPDCRLDHNGMICSGPEDLDLGIRVTSAEIRDEQVLMLRWQYSDGVTTHEGPIPLAWLSNNSNSPVKKAERSSARAMTFHKDKIVPSVDYKHVMDSERGLYEWLCHLEERGICLITNCPKEKGVVSQVAERIAPIQHTVYGETFDVVSQPQPINAAYSPVSLELHMDQVMYENAPGLQLLHCVEFDPHIVGGDNTFADIFELANQLREEKPDYFDTLARVPAVMSTVHYNRDYPVHMHCSRPLFGLNHKKELVTVVWHPMMTHIFPEEEYTEAFFEAYKYFFTMVKNCKSLYSLRMVSGDLISFNNRRVLHGRASYSSQKGLRFLQGTYVELSEFQSRLQVFHNKLGDGRLARRVGMGSWI